MVNVVQEVVGMTAHAPMPAHVPMGHGMQAHARGGITKIVIAAHERVAHDQTAREQEAHVKAVLTATINRVMATAKKAAHERVTHERVVSTATTNLGTATAKKAAQERVAHERVVSTAMISLGTEIAKKAAHERAAHERAVSIKIVTTVVHRPVRKVTHGQLVIGITDHANPM